MSLRSYFDGLMSAAIVMPFFCYLCLLVYNGSIHVLPIWVTCRMPNKRQELITVREHSIGRYPHLFGFLCWFFFCFAYLRPAFCAPTVDSVSALLIFYWLSLRFSLTFICTSSTFVYAHALTIADYQKYLYSNHDMVYVDNWKRLKLWKYLTKCP